MSHRQLQCDYCLTTFSRSEHLRRHLRSHENLRPYKCRCCRRSFTRKDLLTRHQKTCKARHSPLSGHQSRIADQTELPQPPLSMAVTDSRPSLLPELPPSIDFAALDFLYMSQRTSDSITATEKMEHLAYFTSVSGMATFIDRETLKEQQLLLLNESESQLIANLVQTIDPVLLHQPSCRDPLAPKSQEIIRDLQEIITAKSDKAIIKLEWTPNVQAACETFFAPANIHLFLEYFWSLWYPNCSIVHRPSFDPLATPTALLCVMVLIGACLSPHDADGHAARMWLDNVEELVFCNECFQDSEGEMMGNRLDSKSRVELVQAAYLVCSLQKREGSVEAQGRMRRYRHVMMVSVARNIGIDSATHRNLPLNSPSESWWRQFAITEELIRTMTSIFLIDAALAIFHHTPPRMVVSELKMDTACPEACFQAGSAIECFNLLRGCEGSTFWSARLSVADVVRGICQRELDAPSILSYSTMGTLNLFTTIQALHSLMFSLQNSLVFDSTLAPVQIGLENWQRIWIKRQPEDRNIPDQPALIWKKIGFGRYAPEFWHLARIIVDQMTAIATKPGPESSKQGLARYDHTDMTDVNGLIMEYQRLNLETTESF